MVAATARFVPSSLHVDALLVADGGVTVRACSDTTAGCRSAAPRRIGATAASSAPWPICHGQESRSLQLRVRKFFCENLGCPRRIFTARLTGITRVSARRTDRQRDALLAIAVALGGEAGARMAAQLGYVVSPDTLLRLIRQAPEVERPASTMLGVDDWAIHKGLT